MLMNADYTGINHAQLESVLSNISYIRRYFIKGLALSPHITGDQKEARLCITSFLGAKAPLELVQVIY